MSQNSAQYSNKNSASTKLTGKQNGTASLTASVNGPPAKRSESTMGHTNGGNHMAASKINSALTTPEINHTKSKGLLS